jgi:2-dehydropantoate 2-reductase
MKIAIVGCGAMGSIYAALLSSAGHDVIAIDPWPAHVDAINRLGLRVEGASGDRTAKVEAFTDIPEIPVDLVVVAVKAAHIEGVASKLARLLKPETIVLAIQNGVGSSDILAEHGHGDRLCVGVAGGFGAIMRGPGHAYHNGMNVIRIGAYAGLPFGEARRVAAVWREAGFNADAAANVLAMQWEKLICNVAYSAPCALTGMTIGELKDDPEMGPISQEAATEAFQMARALGIEIQIEDPVKFVRDFAARMPAAKPSMLQDHEARRPSEIDVINGAVLRAARRAELRAPVNATLVALVKTRERAFKF